jgi:hypothetical protein
MFNLGDRVKDIVTGFQGIIMARTSWLYGCDRYTVVPEKLDKDGKVQDGSSFDEPQLKLIKAGVVQGDKPKVGEPATAARVPGGPRPEPIRRADVRR